MATGELRSLLFADFLQPGADPRAYVEATSSSDLVRVVEEYLADYNANSKAPMSLVLFAFAVEHVARVCRIIRQPGGHALLVGLGGSGRQSLTRLAAFIEEYKTCQVRLHTASPLHLQCMVVGLMLLVYAVEHVAHVCRIRQQPGGHVLLVSLGGSERQNLARLSAFVDEYKACQIVYLLRTPSLHCTVCKLTQW